MGIQAALRADGGAAIRLVSAEGWFRLLWFNQYLAEF